MLIMNAALDGGNMTDKKDRPSELVAMLVLSIWGALMLLVCLIIQSTLLWVVAGPMLLVALISTIILFEKWAPRIFKNRSRRAQLAQLDQLRSERLRFADEKQLAEKEEIRVAAKIDALEDEIEPVKKTGYRSIRSS